MCGHIPHQKNKKKNCHTTKQSQQTEVFEKIENNCVQLCFTLYRDLIAWIYRLSGKLLKQAIK